jgi:enamine deaminase RidA (YjgF/YER057c/UK114 family)
MPAIPSATASKSSIERTSHDQHPPQPARALQQPALRLQPRRPPDRQPHAPLVGPGDLGAQTAQALANLKAVIEAAGATPADVVRVRTYVVNHSPEAFGPVLTEMAKFYGDAQPAPNTWIGVAALAMPDFMIEIEATVALP